MNPKPAFMILMLTERCNLRCRYCYLEATSAGRDMDEQTLVQALKLADHGASCHLQLSGGEPTLRPDLIEMTGRLSRKFHRPPQLGLQTNATCLEQHLLSLCREYGFQVGVSLDGPPAVQEELRGNATATLKGLELLDRENIPFRVTTVISHRNILELDRLILLLARFGNCLGLGFDLLVRRGRSTSGEPAPASGEELEKGLTRALAALKLVNQTRSRPLQLRELEILRRTWRQQPFCPAVTGRSLAVGVDGTLYTCSQNFGDPEFSRGTLKQPLSGPAPAATNCRLPTTEACSTCHLSGRCPGDCPGRLHHNSVEEQTLACRLWQSLAVSTCCGESNP